VTSPLNNRSSRSITKNDMQANKKIAMTGRRRGNYRPSLEYGDTMIIKIPARKSTIFWILLFEKKRPAYGRSTAAGQGIRAFGRTKMETSPPSTHRRPDFRKKTSVETPRAWPMIHTEKTRPTRREPARKLCDQHGYIIHRHFGTPGLHKNSFLQKGRCNGKELQALSHAGLDLGPSPPNPQRRR